MKAILIDPKARTVSEVEHDGRLDSIHKALECRTIDAVRLERGGAIYVDDEGLLMGVRGDLWYVEAPIYDEDGAFADTYWHGPLAGRGLLVGSTRSGEDGPTPFTLSEVTARVRWRPSWIAAARAVAESADPTFIGRVNVATGDILDDDGAAKLGPGDAIFLLDRCTAQTLISAYELCGDELQLQLDSQPIDRAMLHAARAMVRLRGAAR